MFDLLVRHWHLLDDVVSFADLERDQFGFVQAVEVGHEDRPDELLHALQSHYLHVHDALDLIQDTLRDVTPDANHPLQWTTQFQPELPEYKCIKPH